MNSIPDLARAAAWYTQNRIPVFPLHGVTAGLCCCRNAECAHPGKHPRTARGFKDATTHQSQIERWWQQWSEENIGMPTGAASGLFVLDVDPRNGGEESIERLIALHSPLKLGALVRYRPEDVRAYIERNLRASVPNAQYGRGAR